MRTILGSLQKIPTRLRMRGTASAAILMYHRIAQPDFDPWGLSVAPHNFADHLDILRQYAQPMSLSELATCQRNGRIPQRAVVITFDDGYADNLYHAKPLLERYHIPATCFITTKYLGSQREFWWDELQRVLLQPGNLPETLSLNVHGELKQWHVATQYSQEEYESDRHRKAWEGQPNSRLAFYYSVWSALRILPYNQRQILQNEILNWANADTQGRKNYRALTHEELLDLERGGLVEIGAHTLTHPSLPAHSLAVQRVEIQQSKQELEQLLHHSVDSFAYPFGDFNQHSVRAVKEAGFKQACSTVQLGVEQGSNCFQMPRFEVQNWTRKEFEENISRWLT
jgi:peptidoglycan/xylan/chitin deacetylase (PgdA/CDA1 family)